MAISKCFQAVMGMWADGFSQFLIFILAIEPLIIEIKLDKK